MTWFRVGGAGIPASLKNAMNAVLNKKFGTSGQNYPPNGWPDNVNLLGPLPENTVSGAVASFTDGADDVPIKSASFGIVASGGNGSPSSPVPIVGFNGMTVYHGKKNIFDITTYPITKKRYIRASDGYFAISTIDLRGATEDYIPCVSMRGKTWVINKPNNSSNTLGLAFYDENKAFLSSVLTWPSGTNGVFTVPEDAYYFRFTVDLDSADDTEIQIEAGTTATAFAPYYQPEPNAVTWQSEVGTVYGGELYDDGALHVTHALVPFSDCTWESVTSYQSNFNSTNGIVSLRFSKNAMASAGYAQKVSTSLCNIFDNQSRSVWNNVDRMYEIGYTDGISFNVLYSDIGLSEWTSNATNTLNAFRASSIYTNGYFALELTTPIEVTGLDEININTYLGDNSIWCDTGDSEVTYRQDIALALAALQGSRGLMMSSLRSAEPMIGEESDPEGINELEEPEITEQEGDNDAR